METNNKGGITSYVLVCDVTDNGQLYYYTGYFKFRVPFNTNDYVDAMKLSFKDEAQLLCDKMNILSKVFSYHVEEHMYM